MTLFVLLSICVVSLTLWLTQEIKSFGGKSAELFSKERKIVITTSIIFCTGFLLQAIKNGIAFLGTTIDKSNAKQRYVCNHLDLTNAFQLFTYILQDIVPIGVILSIHHKNFKVVATV
jgi:hypothetical protein